MNTTQEKDVTKLQGNPAKQMSRILVGSQATEWSNKTGVKEITSATLPADSWLFENTYLTLSDIHSSHMPKITFHCAESNPKVFKKALKKMPLNAQLYKGNFEDMVKGQVKWRGGLGFHSETLQPQKYNFLWADYCKNATKEDAQEFARMTASMPSNSIAYITYGIKSREKGGKKQLAKRFKGYTHGSKDVHSAVKGATTYLVKAMNRGRKIELIMDLIYGGGSRGSSTMVILGYSIGTTRKIKPIVKNLREQKAEATARNYNLLGRIESGQIISTHKGFMSRVDYRKRANKYNPPTPSKKKMRIIKFIKKGWDSERIAKRFKVATRTIGGIKAWVLNPKSWK